MGGGQGRGRWGRGGGGLLLCLGLVWSLWSGGRPEGAGIACSPLEGCPPSPRPAPATSPQDPADFTFPTYSGSVPVYSSTTKNWFQTHPRFTRPLPGRPPSPDSSRTGPPGSMCIERTAGRPRAQSRSRTQEKQSHAITAAPGPPAKTTQASFGERGRPARAGVSRPQAAGTASSRSRPGTGHTAARDTPQGLFLPAAPPGSLWLAGLQASGRAEGGPPQSSTLQPGQGSWPLCKLPTGPHLPPLQSQRGLSRQEPGALFPEGSSPGHVLPATACSVPMATLQSTVRRRLEHDSSGGRHSQAPSPRSLPRSRLGWRGGLPAAADHLHLQQRHPEA